MCEWIRTWSKHAGVQVNTLSASCRFHRKAGERCTRDELLKDFGCLELFNVFYPHYLSTVYGGTFPEEGLRLRCPSNTGRVSFKVRTFPVEDPIRRVVAALKKALSWLRPMDYLVLDAGFEVVGVGGQCACGLRVGDIRKVKFKGSLCPALVYALPGKTGLEPEAKHICCPSDMNLVEIGYVGPQA